MKISSDLIKACKQNDRLAQKELYLKLLPYLRAVSSRYLFNSNFIKDVLQESFIKIFKSINSYNPEKGAFLKWAVKITINSTINYNHRMSYKKQEEFIVEKHETAQQPEALANMSKEEMLKELKKMPPQFYEVFNLYIIDEYDHKEIAKLLNISVELSRKRLSRAREWLKKNIRANTNVEIKIHPSHFSTN